MNPVESIRLLDVEPDLGRFLQEGDRAAIGDVCVPVALAGKGELDLRGILRNHRAFGAVLLEGLVVRRICVGESSTLRLLGPGDLINFPSVQMSSALIAATGWRVAAPARLAVLGREVLLAAHRAPRLVAGLHARGAEQTDRVAVQLAICQLPRVEDRVLSMLWLLAESWGQVTGHGTTLRLALTHETLGGLVGAKRSTVTLALGQLTEEGAIMRHERGWLLLEPPPSPAGVQRHEVMAPELLDAITPAPQADAAVELDPAAVLARVQELREVRSELARIRERNAARVARDMERARETRRRSSELRRLARARRAEEYSVPRFHHHDGARDAVGAAQRQADDAAVEGLAPAVDGVEH